MINEIIIIENYLNDELIVKIASAVDKSQEIYENSWDNTVKKYKLTIKEVVEKAIIIYELDYFWIYIITNWNNFYWNDIQCWIESIKEKELNNE